MELRYSGTISILLIMFIGQACLPNEHDKMVSRKFTIQLADTDSRLKQHHATLLFDSQPFTGKRYSLNNTNDTVFISHFINGLEHGLSTKWFNTRQKQEERNYENGKRIGIHQGWFENGQLKFRYQYENDAMNGLAEEWYSSGAKCKEMHYKNGHESGLQRMWGPDGSVKANYEARNGRNYGLTGTKNCKNVWQEIKH